MARIRIGGVVDVSEIAARVSGGKICADIGLANSKICFTKLSTFRSGCRFGKF